MKPLKIAIFCFVIFPFICIGQEKNQGLKISGLLLDGNSYYKIKGYQQKITLSRMSSLEYYKNFGKANYKPWSILVGLGYSRIGINKYDTIVSVDQYYNLNYLKPQVSLRRRERISRNSLLFIDIGLSFNYGITLKSFSEYGEEKSYSNFGSTLSIHGGGGLYFSLTSTIRGDVGFFAESDFNAIKEKNLNGLKFNKNCLRTSIYYAF